MAGKVLRSSNGRYAGSTRGWGKGRTSHGGGFGSGTKGKTKQLRSAAQTQARVKAGVAVGVYLGASAVNLAASRKTLSGGGNGARVVQLASTVAAVGAGIAGRSAIKKARSTR